VEIVYAENARKILKKNPRKYAGGGRDWKMRESM
jgi:hypothetical protein